ncbi:MAG: type III-B CRISPR module RAMP protein Cmr6, partial [Bacteroidales bacterium]
YYKRDRFFDAYPTISLGHDGCFLRNDYITPHINREKPEMSPFTSPNPIQFLKVLPKVKFQFQFQLKEGGGLKEKQKELLFKEILCFMGAGAKTNVGYGQFEEGFRENTQSLSFSASTIENIDSLNYTGKIKMGEMLEAKVIDQESKIVQIVVQGNSFQIKMTGNCPENGKIINVKINQLNRQNEITQVGFMGEKRT